MFVAIHHLTGAPTSPRRSLRGGTVICLLCVRECEAVRACEGVRVRACVCVIIHCTPILCFPSSASLAEVTAKVTAVEKAIGTFEGAVTNIERNRAKFPHVDDRELNTRKDAVSELRRRLLTARATLNSRKALAKLDADRRAVRVACFSAVVPDAVSVHVCECACMRSYVCMWARLEAILCRVFLVRRH